MCILCTPLARRFAFNSHTRNTPEYHRYACPVLHVAQRARKAWKRLRDSPHGFLSQVFKYCRFASFCPELVQQVAAEYVRKCTVHQVHNNACWREVLRRLPLLFVYAHIVPSIQFHRHYCWYPALLTLTAQLERACTSSYHVIPAALLRTSPRCSDTTTLKCSKAVVIGLYSISDMFILRSTNR